MPQPTVGRTVLYQLSDDDARHITQQRATNGISGNAAAEGQVFPAVVVRIFPGNPHDVVNLKVLLDGPDIFWATSRHEGDEPGTWAWPERV
ncbi:hypothetical protein OG352_05140 [Streptomyces sp. NBC_01485]|uniref:hypothetical protein n=1 Tax=Streptomyces sp. NBC_01485 TaxID=2903884 RepID=UPI002E30CD4E|nr:hypothetical protein [Streptomyces sp. NBC_01485]